MTLHVNNFLTWIAPYEVDVNDAGTWRRIQQVAVNDAGTWRFIHDDIRIVDTSFTRFDGSPVEFTLNVDGDWYTRTSSTLDSQGPWIGVATHVGLYEARATPTSGTFSTGTSGSWVALSSTQSWTRNSGAGVSTGVTFTLEIRRASDQVVVDTATITMTCDRT